MSDIIVSNVLLDVDQALQGFNGLPCEQRRSTLATIVNKLCTEELSHVVEIVVFLKKYFDSSLVDRSEVLVMGVEELLKYLNELKQCPAKSGCLLLVYSLLNELTDIPEQDVSRVTDLKYPLEFVIREVAELINQPVNDELIAVASLFDRVSHEVLNQLFEEAYTDRSEVRDICAFLEHLPCIDQQIKACLVLHRKMLMDSARLRTGATALAFRVRKIKRYTDFARAKHADELRRLKLALPEGVYAIIWNYASISAGQFMQPGVKLEKIADVKGKTAAWAVPATKLAKHEFITVDGGRSFSIRNSDSGLFLSEIEDGFCYVEKTDDVWSVEVIRREDDYFYKITNGRTGNSLSPPQQVQLDMENKDDGYNLVDFTERSLVAVQKFELNRPSGRCTIQ